MESPKEDWLSAARLLFVRTFLEAMESACTMTISGVRQYSR